MTEEEKESGCCQTLKWLKMLLQDRIVHQRISVDVNNLKQSFFFLKNTVPRQTRQEQ